MVLIKHDEKYYAQRKPQPDLGPIKNFKRFIWDAEKRAFLGRTAQEWMSVGVFYLCFYSVLFSFFAFHMWITYKNVACLDKPSSERESSSMGKAWLEPSRSNMPILLNLHGPGIAFKPNILREGRSPRILVDGSTDLGKPQRYIDEITKILEDYKIDRTKFSENCSDKTKRDADKVKECFFDYTSLGQCSRSPYGYSDNSPTPCVYITFNKRFGWLPIYYSQASILPQDMPQWLQKIVHQSDQFHVWLSCEGKSKDDRARLGEIEYLPRPGFPVHFFPFNGRKHYLSPVVALRFNNLPGKSMNLTTHVSSKKFLHARICDFNHQVTVECKAWARNIDNENRYHLNFKIMIK